MFGLFKKKNKNEWPETKCIIILPDGGLVEVNQVVYDYIRDLERQLKDGKDDDPHIVYLCDRKGCNGEEGCSNPDCYLTTEIEHAVNFHKAIEGFYEENCVSPEMEHFHDSQF